MNSTYSWTGCTTEISYSVHGSSVAQDGLLLIPPVRQLVTHGWNQHLRGHTSKQHTSSHSDVEGHGVFMHVSKENVANTVLYIYLFGLSPPRIFHQSFSVYIAYFVQRMTFSRCYLAMLLTLVGPLGLTKYPLECLKLLLTQLLPA